MNIYLCVVVIIANLYLSQAREVTRAQQYNPNSDFLVHESAVGSGYKPDPAQFPLLNSQTSRAPNIFKSSDFPALNPSQEKPENSKLNGQHENVAYNWPKSSSTTSQSSTSLDLTKTTLTPKRDYVAPQVPTKPAPVNLPSSSTNSDVPGPVTPLSTGWNGKRDYVASEFPTLRPPKKHNSQSTLKPTSLTTSGKRDYVAPKRPALPHPSGIVSPSNENSQHNTKPISFSDAVSGSKKQSFPSQTIRTPTSVTTTTQKSSVVPTSKSSTYSPKLPSSIVTINKNNNEKKVSASDEELQRLSEELLKKDTNNAAKHITINYQEKTTSQSKEDKAPLPLLAVPDIVWNIPTIQKFLPLLDNYEWDTLINEHVTPQERNEENAFMDAIMTTTVIRFLMNFLKEKGYVTPDPKQQRDFLKQLWFSLYSRGKGKISSSGFEHIFVSELKNGEVSGLHNWIYFAKQEALNKVNYLGYLKYSQFNDKGAVLKLHFSQQGVDKPVDTMFVGTSPELEIALYTLCFVARADNDCNLKLGGKNINVVTHTFRYRSKNLIGSAYPQITN